MKLRTKWSYSILALALILVLAGCGQAQGSAPSATEEPADAQASTATEVMEEMEATATEAMEAEPTATDEPQPSLTVQETSLGEVLVNLEGLTLYAFTEDGAGESSCGSGCIDFWPPLTVEAEPLAGEGIDASLLGTFVREDGSLQVTYADHPLYTYAEDAAPGDVNGQGVNGTWFAVDAGGSLLQTGEEGDDLNDLY